MKALGDSHTAYDVMREYMIIGAELDGKISDTDVR